MKARFLWRAWKARLRDESAELRAIRAALAPGDTVVDVGANKGSYLYWLSRWVESGRVVAFEPQAALARYLNGVVGALGLSNVVVEPRAVTDRTGEIILLAPGEGESPSASINSSSLAGENCRRETVSCVTLDEYFSPAERIRILKIDVEGHELSVFRGAERILREQKLLLVFECENRHLEPGSVHDVFAHLEALGYRGSFIDGGEPRPLGGFRADAHQRQAGERFWDAKGYCNNFIFRVPG